MKKGEENQVVSEGISQGEIMPNVDVPALSLVGSIVMKIFIIRKEREGEREKERRRETRQDGNHCQSLHVSR